MRFNLLLILFTIYPLTLQAAPPRTFNEAKKLIYKLYKPESVDFYCGCQYKGKQVDLKSCGYIPRKNQQRASNIEIEHIVTAWSIGHQRQCWQKGGRKNCNKYDPVYQQAEADLFNLIPVIGEQNQDRSNFRYAWINEKPYQYGQCQAVTDFKARKYMPRPEVRGLIARTNLYMADRYNLKLSSQQRKLFEVWNKSYPVTDYERKRNQKIVCIMGWSNKYVETINLDLCTK